MHHTPVAVMPDRKYTAYTGENAADVQTFPVMDLDAALGTRFDTYAHFTPGVCYINGVAQTDQPRFSVSGTYPEDWHWLFHAVAIDVDHPEKAPTDEWWEAETEKLAKTGDLWTTAFWYRSRGGYRLVWRLAQPLEKQAYLPLLHNVYAALRAVDVKPDEFYDWTRLYALPLVRRDGVDLNFPRSAGPLQELPPLAHVAATSDSFLRIVQSRPSALSFGEWPAGERNSRMFAAVAEFWRKVDGLDQAMLIDMAQTLNEHRCGANPLTDSEIETIVNNVIRYKAPAPATTAPQPAVTAPAPAIRQKVYVHKGHMPSAVDGTLAVIANNPGIFYKQSGNFVRLARRPDGSMQIEELQRPALRDVLERHIAFMTTKVTKDEIIEVPIDMPKDLLDVVGSCTDHPGVLELQEVLTTPTLTPDGDLLVDPGYCAELQLYYAPTADVAQLNVGSTQAEAVAALDKLRDIVSDFPFAAPEHQSAAIAAIITALVRSAIRGPTPLFIFDSTTPGSGKSLLADVTALLATGTPAPRMALTGEDEFEKRVTALLMSGARTVLIDNIDKPLGGATLDALLTSDQWSGRVLGSTRMVSVRSRAVWMATGNNVQIQGDLSRRALRVYLDPNMERPEERDGFKYADLLAYVRAHRAELAAACLTIVRAYVLAGSPPTGIGPLGSFESWSNLVRAPLVWLGETDPLLSQQALRNDNTTVTWGSVLNTIFTIWQTGTVTTKELFDAAFRGVRSKPGVKQETYTALEAALEELCGAKPSVKQLSWILRKWRNRIIDGMVLRQREGRDRVKGNLYYVEAPEKLAGFISAPSAASKAPPEDSARVSFFDRKDVAGG
jgi:hypothetical protein